MKFRQSAALGLSSLLFSSNLLMPYAVATSMAMGTQPELTQHLKQNPIVLALTETTNQLQHPFKTRHHQPRVLKAFEPVLDFWETHRHPAKIAKTLRFQNQAQFLAKPIEPQTSINPSISDTNLKEDVVTQSQPILRSGLSATVVDNQTEAIIVAPEVLPERKDEQPHQESMTHDQHLAAQNAIDPQEFFQMLASSPLDKIAALSQSKTANTPRLDTSKSPSIKLRGTGNVKVLRSGVSQKTTSLELTVGKAEVIYLSRPAGRIAVSNPDVASAVVISPTQIQLIGKTVGVSNLLIWSDMKSPDHTVVDVSVHRDVSVLVNQLKYVDPGIQIVPMAAEDTVILTGEAESRESAQLAIEMAKAFFNKSGAATASNSNGISSQAPGSALPGLSTNVINLIKVKGEPSTKIELVRKRLLDIDSNIHLEVVPGPEGSEKVILTGRVPTASMASKALNLASIFYGQPGIKLITAQGGNEFARMQISGSGNSQTTTTTAGGANGAGSEGVNVLQGSVMTDATGNVVSMLEVAQKPQIKCSIKFLELNKTALNALGGTISGTSGNTMLGSWSGVQSPAPGKPISTLSTQDPSGAAWRTLKNSGGISQVTQGQFNEVFQNGITQVFSINNQLTGAIQALQEKKQVRTLAEPTLTMLSGEQGSFLAGGEIPIAFVGGQGQVSIQYKEFGIRLNLLPNITDDGKIQMQVAPEVSALDQTKGVSTNSISVPAFVSRRMQTTLIVEPGQSFALAGLYSQEDTNSVSRFPGIGSLPIIGAFFRNKWDNRSNSEMVVIIKPEVIMTQTGPIKQAANSLQPSGLPIETKTEVSQK